MDVQKIETLLNRIVAAAQQIEGQDAELADYTTNIRRDADQIRQEVIPPPEDNRSRTRDQISPREWAEYEWHDVTAMGDRQRQYIRGLKR